jgi:hypothetical protein
MVKRTGSQASKTTCHLPTDSKPASWTSGGPASDANRALKKKKKKIKKVSPRAPFFFPPHDTMGLVLLCAKGTSQHITLYLENVQ